MPDDGKVNGIAHSYLVKSGSPAAALIIMHVFNQPELFFQSLDKDAGKWLYGTQSNAASTLAKIGYIKLIIKTQKNFIYYFKFYSVWQSRRGNLSV